MLVSDIVRRNVSAYADRQAVVVAGFAPQTWGELDERTDQFGRALLSLGLHKGDRLAMYAPNCAEYIDFFFACAKTGIVGSAINVRLAGPELSKYLRYIEPAVALVHADLDAAASFLDDVPSVRHIVGFGGPHSRTLDLETLIAAEDAGDPGCAVDETDTYQLGATSGTTGSPKGAILNHRNAIAAMVNWIAEMPVPPESTNLQNIPLFFNPGGPAGLHPALLKGGRTVIVPAFDPGRFLSLVPEYAVNHCILVPTMLNMVLEHPTCGQQDLSSLVGISMGGSPLSRSMLTRAREIFGDVFYPQYGLAETYSSGLILRPADQHTEGTDEQLRRLGSLGKPHIMMKVRVVDQAGVDVQRDNSTPGEIWMQGDTLSSGYFRLPEETVASRHGDWFKTGDVAIIDDDGFITIVDRMKDIIITGGINVYSREVEEALESHPDVLQAAVIGIPDEQWGESIHGIVVLRSGGVVAADELITHVAGQLASFKKPRSVDFVDALPLGGTGKVLKRELRASFWEGTGRKV